MPSTDHSPAPGEPVLVLLTTGPDGAATPRLADPAAPHLTVTDQGATRGDGLFETALAVADASGTFVMRKPGAHLGRLAASAAALMLPVPEAPVWEAAMAAGLDAFAAANDVAEGDRLAVKLTVTRGPEVGPGEPPRPTAWVLLTPAARPDPAERRTGVRVLLLDRGLDSTVAERAPWLLTGAKTLSYAVNMAALRHARAHGADDVVFTSADGYLLEGPTSTLLLARRGPDGVRRLVTPLRRKGILAGTSQSVIFAAAQAAGWALGYGPLVPADLEGADGLWLVSSLRGVLPIRAVDGRETPVDAELTERLQAWLDADGDPGEHVSGDPVRDEG
ncbi:aminotransferase class IV [Micrococcus sp.]|uniref:aminotransferase class IV n=1 Tax=Micrococcus sp. TaxID=1271 RepID=UPI0026DC2983|nr:aminotransferase class IV [Micrococcus sp.]MDO4240262.1 aminotransferase class IV [Micrococcus sp.]